MIVWLCTFCLFSRRGICGMGSCLGISTGARAHNKWLPFWEPNWGELLDTLCLHPPASEQWIHCSQWEANYGFNQHMDQSGVPQVWPLLSLLYVYFFIVVSVKTFLVLTVGQAMRQNFFSGGTRHSVCQLSSCSLKQEMVRCQVLSWVCWGCKQGYFKWERIV